jgi:uncharacterized membrane protein YfcA
MIELSLIGPSEILPFIAIGFASQLVDGALGMAFGVLSSTLLLTMGMPPAQVSAAVHAVETFTTAASGANHVIHRNVDWRLFARLLIPGVIGGVIGAYVLTHIDASSARPFIMVYLLMLAIFLIWRGVRHIPREASPRFITPLALAGGFLDAAGGGGWGPIVTSNLLAQGAAPRQVIGTVVAAEFFLTLSISLAFLIEIGWAAFTVVTAGLLLGGIVAAPFGAIIARRASARLLLILVGTILAVVSLSGLVHVLQLW